MHRAEIVLLAALLCALPSAAAAAAAPEAPGAEQGCVAVESIKTVGDVCRARLRNGCTGAVAVTANFEVHLWRFVPHVIPPAPPDAGHAGEPAAGHYVDAGLHTGERTGVLAAGASEDLEYSADGERSLIVDCRVRVRATPAS
jgi:hypothetical protein